MSMFRRIAVCLLVTLSEGRVGAQNRGDPEADALLARVAESYLSRPHVEITAFSRELRVQEFQDAESTVPAYRVSGAEYGRLVLSRRLPNDWRIVSQREQVVRGEAQPSRTMVLGRLGAGESAMLLLNATSKATARMTIPEGMFEQEVTARLGGVLGGNALFRLFFNASPVRRGNWAVFHGQAAELKIEGVEEVDGVQLTRIVSSWPPMVVTRLWIDPATLTLVRVLETPGEQPHGMRMFLEVKETIYRHDIQRGSADADFDLEEGWAVATPNIASAAGFSPSSELFAALAPGGAIKPQAPAARNPKAPGTPRQPPVSTPGIPPVTSPGNTAQVPVVTPAPVPTAEPPKVEEQQLTAEQMRAIVLIEGDDGAGTGFVAKMRGVFFVITNLHVAGGNSNMRISTVSGEQVKTGPMFGAVGRDLALMRIEGEWKGATLELCEDPLATAKLGDKVVVVGNRRGGGVATQVSGVVQGIGPDKIEVNAPFQPGNSGSPIIQLSTGQVLGLASFSLTRKLDDLDGPATNATGTPPTAAKEAKSEQRWFGYRTDGAPKWEMIDQSKWQAQQRRIADFQEDSEAIYHAMQARFKEASRNAKVRVIVDRFEERANRGGSSRAAVMLEVNEFFRSLRALADVGVKELKAGEFYDFFRTSGYWESSIPDQLAAREDLARRLDAATENTSAFLAKLRR